MYELTLIITDVKSNRWTCENFTCSVFTSQQMLFSPCDCDCACECITSECPLKTVGSMESQTLPCSLLIGQLLTWFCHRPDLTVDLAVNRRAMKTAKWSQLPIYQTLRCWHNLAIALKADWAALSNPGLWKEVTKSRGLGLGVANIRYIKHDRQTDSSKWKRILHFTETFAKIW